MDPVECNEPLFSGWITCRRRREAIAAEAGFITNPGRSTGQEPGLIGA